MKHQSTPFCPIHTTTRMRQDDIDAIFRWWWCPEPSCVYNYDRIQASAAATRDASQERRA